MDGGQELGFKKKFYIKDASEKDISFLSEIDKRVSPFPWKKEHFFFEFFLPQGKIWVAKSVFPEGEPPVGFLVFRLHETFGEILNLAVYPDFQKKGIASAFLKKTFQESKKNNLNYLILESRLSNQPANLLYKKFHFHNVCQRKRHYPSGETALVWKKIAHFK